MKTLIMICPTTSQPRYHKRAEQLRDLFKLRIFAFSRGLYEENTFPESFAVTVIGKLKDGNYLSRILKLILAVFVIRKSIKGTSPDDRRCYTFSLDTLMIARLCGIKNCYYEVGDIRFSRDEKNVFTMLELLLSKWIDIVIVTSPQFVNELKKTGGRFRTVQYLVIENKLKKGLSRPPARQEDVGGGRRLKIGVVGFLRYNAPLRKIIAFTERYGEAYELHCWGDGPCRHLFEASKHENINFYGSFRNPEDLEYIYNKIDINYAVYGGDEKSKIGVDLAIPNKLYESIFFGVPLVGKEQTEFGRVISRLGIGIEANEHNFEAKLLALDEAGLARMRENCRKVSTSELIDSGGEILRAAVAAS